MPHKNLLVVAACLVNAQNEVLLAQRPPGKMLAGRWEFPGGKVDEGETPEAALARELHEELGIHIDLSSLEPFWFLSHGYPEHGFHLIMPVWLVKRWQGEAKALEHTAICWKKPSAMHELPMIEADAELVTRLQQALS